MENTPAPQASDSPPPEELKPRADSNTSSVAPGATSDASKLRRRAYRPSHKATFIGLAVVIAILAVNLVIFDFLLKKQSATNGLANKGQVTLSSADLNQLGINRGSLGSSGVLLTVAPDAQFKGKLAVQGTTNLTGDVTLNGKLTGTNASFTQLQAGDTSLSKLNVNGDATISTLNLRKDLVVGGVTQLQGAVTIKQLLTVTNNLVVQGNLSIGGTFSAHSLASTSTLTVGGHLITSGPTPSVARGGAVGSNGTVTLSGNDAAGSIAINIGAGAVAGTLANVSFATNYGNLPRVVISPVGVGANFYITNLSVGGFSVAVGSGLPPGGYHIEYIAEQ